MPKARTNKVVCYIGRDGHLLTFVHDGYALDEVGVKVPAGTIKPSESPEEAALREAREETGLKDLRVVRKLGEADYRHQPLPARDHAPSLLRTVDEYAHRRTVASR